MKKLGASVEFIPHMLPIEDCLMATKQFDTRQASAINAPHMAAQLMAVAKAGTFHLSRKAFDPTYIGGFFSSSGSNEAESNDRRCCIQP